MSKIADTEANATSLDGLVNDNGLITTLRNGPKPSWQYIVDQVYAQLGYAVAGSFVDGFTYTGIRQVGADASGNTWIYTGGEQNLPHVVPAGTVPSAPDYFQVSVNSADNVVLDNGENSQQAIDRLNGEIDSLQEYIDGQQFASVDAVKAYSKLSKLIGQRITTGEYHAGTGYGGASYDVVSAGSVTPNGIDIIQGVADSGAALVLHFDGQLEKLGAKEFGFGGDFSEAYDSSNAANRAAELSRASGGQITVTSKVSLAFKSQVDFRFLTLDLVNVDITVDNAIEDAILMGDRATGGYSSNQKIGLVVRDGDSGFSPDLNKPIIRVSGAKGQDIYIRACPFVLFYADTNTAVNYNESSSAYSTFSGESVRVIKLGTAPTTDGSLVQWINENTFNFKRVDKVIIGGTYSHNHNIFNTGTFEGEPEILIEKGNSNVFKNIRFEKYEGLADPIITFGGGTWGNLIEQSWYSSYRRLFENRDEDITLTNSGFGNGLVRSADYMLRNIDILSICRGNVTTFSNTGLNTTSVKGFYAEVNDADSYKMSVGFRKILKTDFIPCRAGCGFNVEMQETASIRVKWLAYDQDFNPVNIANNVNAGLDGSTSILSGNSATQGANVSNSIFAVLGNEIAYLRIEIISGSSGTDIDYLNIKAIVDYAYRRNLSEGCLAGLCQPTCTGVPSKGYAVVGETVADDATGTQYRCTASTDKLTSGTSASGSTTLNLDSVSGIGIGDVVGVKLSSGTHWTTSTGQLSATQIALSDALPEVIPAGRRVTTSRWV